MLPKHSSKTFPGSCQEQSEENDACPVILIYGIQMSVLPLLNLEGPKVHSVRAQQMRTKSNKIVPEEDR